MALAYDKSGNGPGIDRSWDRARFTLTPSDTVPPHTPPDGIYVGVTGNITIKNKRGETVLFTAVPAGQTLLVGGPSYVMATGTTASALVGIVDKSLR